MKPPLDGIRILLIDDDADSVELLDFYLRGEGAVVVTASSAAEARASVAASRPHVILSDIELPDQDGFSLLTSLRTTSRTPAIAVTGHTGRAARERAESAGFDRYVTKPVDLAELTRTVLHLVAEPSA